MNIKILKFNENFEIFETFWKFYHLEIFLKILKSYEIFESFEIL